MRRVFFSASAVMLTFMPCFVGTATGATVIRVDGPIQPVPRFGRADFVLSVPGAAYRDPLDTDEVDVSLLIHHPVRGSIVLPAFFRQPYERDSIDGRGDDWLHPSGPARWEARYAPDAAGEYRVRARVRDSNGERLSPPVSFSCVTSDRRGFLRANPRDRRWLQFDSGEPFFPIGQNLAYIGGQQYVTMARLPGILEKLSTNGVNFLRVWTCCGDWAMSLEGAKNAWYRSWDREGRKRIVTWNEGTDTRRGLRIARGESIKLTPCHPVGLKPSTAYRLSGRAMGTDTASMGTDTAELIIRMGERRWTVALPAEGGGTNFHVEFTTAGSERWMGPASVQAAGGAALRLDALVLSAGDGTANLLWEADVNRPPRAWINPVDAEQLDRVVELAERHELYLMLCLLVRDPYMKDLKDPASEAYRTAVRDARRTLRYAVARWGWSTHVAAWEYFNEIDPGLPTDAFYAALAEELDRIDPYRHLRTTSTWAPSAKDARLPALDIAQVHHYMRENDKDFADTIGVVGRRAAFLREHAPAKPAWIGEFGLGTEKWGLSDFMKRDRAGVHFHEALWASALSGLSGTALSWWWDTIDRQDLYQHYRPLARFMKGVNLEGARPARASSPDPALHVSALHTADRILLWIADRDAGWHVQVAESRSPVERRGARVVADGLAPGPYDVEWWNTVDGTVAREDAAAEAGGTLALEVPAFRQDIAVRITRKP